MLVPKPSAIYSLSRYPHAVVHYINCKAVFPYHPYHVMMFIHPENVNGGEESPIKRLFIFWDENDLKILLVGNLYLFSRVNMKYPAR